MATIATNIPTDPTSHAHVRGPVSVLLRRWAVLALAAALLTVALDLLDIQPFGYSQLVTARTWFTLLFLLHLMACLASFGRRDEVLILVTTPFLAQSYQVCLGRDAPPGALSLPRLLPYLVLGVVLVMALWRRRYLPSRAELALSTVVLAASTLFWVIGSEHTMVGFTVTFFLGVLLPAFAMYVASVSERRPELMSQFAAALTLGIFLMMIGFLVTFGLGTTLETARGAGSIESAREVGDFNSLISYLLLCWPFALCYLRDRSVVLTAALFVLFLVVSFAGVSKTMMVLAPPLVLLSLPTVLSRLRPGALLAGLLIAGVLLFALVKLVASLPIGMFMLDLWLGRLDIDRNALDTLSIADLINPVALGSEAWDDRSVLRAEAMRIFYEHPLTGTGWATFPFLSFIEQGTSHALTTDLLQQTGLIGTALFWCVTVEIIARLIGFVRGEAGFRRLALLFPASFLIWLVAAHTVGAQLFMAAHSGFTVNVITGMLYVMYLRRETVRSCGTARLPTP